MDVQPGSVAEYLAAVPVLLRQGVFRFRVISDSMRPQFHPGDLLEIKPVLPEQLRVGDPVLLSRGGRLICHRLVRLYRQESRDWVVTRGDAVTREDLALPAEEVLGRVDRILRPRFLRRWTWRVRTRAAALLQQARFGAVTGMMKLARYLEFFSVALLQPRELMQYGERYYSVDRIAHLDSSARRGFSDSERDLFTGGFPQPGKALVLGCEAGREAIGLAGLGWQVTAMEILPDLVAAARANAEAAGLRIDWRCQDFLETPLPGGRFDLIGLFGHFYSRVPTHRLRIRLLRACAERLLPGGGIVLTFMRKAEETPQKERLHRWRVRLAGCLRGNEECQPGDQWLDGKLFLHWFSDEEMVREAAEAGLSEGPYQPNRRVPWIRFFRVDSSPVSLQERS